VFKKVLAVLVTSGDHLDQDIVLKALARVFDNSLLRHYGKSVYHRYL